ncbi:MAG: alpha-2-macroglobulin family protein [Spirochaetaceae bacterium]|jgi:uncharacterized protein YfaS (alpha-2-macroglobulin family)|nr:alpha-2-macroglobulin family protein [Spirochaetaceae bacterium]
MSNHKGRNWLRFFLGSYTPPGFLRAIYHFFAGGKFGEKCRAFADFNKRAFKAHRARYIAAYAALIVAAGAFTGWRMVSSRTVRPIRVGFTWSVPDNRVGEEGQDGFREERPLTIAFEASAARVEAVDTELASGITINPPLAGSWKWEGDSVLVFTAGENWALGKKYTVSFEKDFFPPHIKADKNFSFSLPGFELSGEDIQFYIDPENDGIKRVLATVRANYPMDRVSLERCIRIEPNISAGSGSLEKRRYTFTVNYNETGTAAYIVSESLGLPAKQVTMVVSVARGVADESGGSVSTVPLNLYADIPSMTSYASVESLLHDLVMNQNQLYDQVLILATRGTIEESELSKNIGLWELPVNRPALPGLKEVENYNWYSADEAVPEVLNASRRIDLEAIPGELRYNSVTSYKFSAESGRYVFLRIKNGTRFYGGYVLDEPYEAIFRVKEYPRELSILSSGSILAYSGDKRLSLLSRGIQNVRFEIGRVRPDDINHLVSQSSGDISNIRYRNYGFSDFNITEQFQETANIPLASGRDVGYFSFDFSRYLENIPSRNLRHGLFIFSVKEDVERPAYQARRLIVVTDLGFFVKTNTNGTRDVFVQSIATGAPVDGAQLTVLGLNGNPVYSAYTGPDGHVQVPNLQDYRNDRAPTVFTVRMGEDLSFMPYSPTGRNLDYSSFDVGGLQGASDPKTLRAFLFSDRGLYRPGDEVRIAMAVKSGDWAVNLGGTPLECQVTDPRGAEIYNRRISLSPEGVEEIRFSTQDWSPTGTYTASVYVIRERNNREEKVFLGSTAVKVEEFLPDTLNVQAAFTPLPGDGWIAPSELSALVTVRNLFGTPAAGNEVKAQINLVPSRQYFRQYRDYSFQDPFLTGNSYQEFLGSMTTDSDGKASFGLDLAKFEKATYNLSFYAEAFEKGSGRNVSAETSVYVSPLPYLIGCRSDGSLSYIQRDASRVISLIAIDNNAQRTVARDLTFTIMELRYVSALVLEPSGVYKYQSIQKEYPVSQEKVTIPASGLEYRLPSSQSGEFRLVISGPDELEYNRLAFTVAGQQNLQRSLNRTAQLDITLDKADYAPGETIELMIKAPYEGAGLITIERDRVYGYKWFRSTGETTVQTITMPAGLEGNGYVNVQFVRSQDSPEIFMSPLSYGAVPFSVSRENRTIGITLDFPQEAKPGEDFVIKYAASRPGKIIVYAVDEGILQLAAYQTPDPLGFFFRKQALEVRTIQILDLVLPKYSIVRSMGGMGGGAGADALNRNLNPFKRKQYEPVAYWSGIVDAGRTVRELSYRIPDYFNGTLRVMAVAVGADSVGAAEERSFIRSTFIISPNTPMTASPGDEFELALTVTNNQKGSGADARVRLRAVPSPHLAISGRGEFDLAIPEGADATLAIPVRAAGPLGAAEIRFTASRGSEGAAGYEVSTLSSYMSIRPAVPYRVSLSSGVMRNRSVELPVERVLYDEFHTRDVTLSYLPLGISRGLKFFLDNYPYGCSEQLISAAFPFLYQELFRELEFSRQQADEAVYRVMGILQARMKENGSIGMWTANTDADPFITVYAAHFLTEAKNRGYYVAPSVMERMLQAARDIASSQDRSLYSLAGRAYAVYILTLNEIVTTPLVESLKGDIARYNTEAATELPGLFLAGSYALLRRDFDAFALAEKIKWSMRFDDSIHYFDELLYDSLYLALTARHFPQRLREVSETLLSSMAGRLENQRYTTLSASFALMAVDAYLKAVPGVTNGRFEVLEILKGNTRRPLSLAPGVTGGPASPGAGGAGGTGVASRAAAAGALFSTSFSADAGKIRIENRDALNLFYQVTQGGFDREIPAAEVKNNLEVYREFLDDSGEAVESVKVGSAITVRVNFRTTNNKTITNLALVDLLPAGLEADIDSVRRAAAGESAGGYSNWRPDYVDVREDRIVVYGRAGPQVTTFSYRARAINPGSFTVPPLFAEAMYDKSVWALRPQAPLVVQKETP